MTFDVLLTINQLLNVDILIIIYLFFIYTNVFLKIILNKHSTFTYLRRQNVSVIKLRKLFKQLTKYECSGYLKSCNNYYLLSTRV